MSRLIVVGAGAMGLAAAYHAAKAGHDVEVLEAGPVAGGMAAHFDLDGLSIERFYHFICKADTPTFELLRELGIEDRLRWRDTSMGYFAGGRLHRWGDPISLLTYPEIGLVAKLRYGLLAFVSTRRDGWAALETQSAREWITRWAGKQAYDRLWRPLFELKFYDYADDISAAWIWTRVKRIGTSRTSLFQEQLGYLDGGSEVLIARLVERIEAMGGIVRLGSPVSRVVAADGRVAGVDTPSQFRPADAVISTIPTPLVSAMVPDLPPSWKARYDAIVNIGVACLVFKLRRSISPHFWVNISMPDIPIPGIIEFSNLRPTPDGTTVVFVPYYMPVTNPKFSWPDTRLLDEAFAVLRQINPSLAESDILASEVARLRYAQPVCEPGFAAKIPPVQTPIGGLQVADTSFYYPEDRGIAESVRLGKEMAERVSI